MKQIELKLKKRLLIREFPTAEDLNTAFDAHKSLPDLETKLICKGSELTEEIAKELVKTKRIKNVWDNFMSGVYVNYEYKDGFIDQYKTTALESFISAIEAQGYYWGENPIEKPAKNDLNGSFFTMQTNFHQEKAYDEAESRTFNREKTLIFEIL